MICCKIITNYNSSKGNISKLFTDLTDYGVFLWDSNNLFFSNTDDTSVTKDVVSDLMRKNGYPDFYISVYSKDNEPTESDYVNGWITDKLIKINYNEYEMSSQKLFKDISHGLDLLDDEIKNIENKKQEQEAESNE